jgi:sugar phosphate isomerase/epimerase
MQEAWDAIGPWVRSVDVKDSITDLAAPLGYRYVPLGEGDVPVAEAVRVLRAGGYDGWLTCEWEKLWHPDLAPPEIAFPQFIAEMRRLLDEGGKGRTPLRHQLPTIDLDHLPGDVTG